MKKLFAIVLTLLIGFSAVSAQDFTLGGRLGAVFGFHSFSDEFFYPDSGLEEEHTKSNFNFAFYGAYALTDRLSLQAELNFMINQGIKFSFSEEYYGLEGAYKISITNSSLDIPILLKFAVAKKPVLIGLLAGPHLSFPLGKLILSGDIEDLDMVEYSQYSTNGITFGLSTGLFAGFPVGRGRITGDIRFLFDFTPVNIHDFSYGKNFDTFTRQGVALTAGYEFSF